MVGPLCLYTDVPSGARSTIIPNITFEHLLQQELLKAGHTESDYQLTPKDKELFATSAARRFIDLWIDPSQAKEGELIATSDDATDLEWSLPVANALEEGRRYFKRLKKYGPDEWPPSSEDVEGNPKLHWMKPILTAVS